MKDSKSINISKKKYIIKINDNKYNLRISLDNEDIEFKVYQLNDKIFIYYKNKFDIKNINDIFSLNFNNMAKVIEFIDSVYINNKILITFDINNVMNYIIKYSDKI